MPIRWKLILSIGVPLLIVWSVALALNFPRLRTAAMEQTQRTLAKEAQLQAARLDRHFEMLAQIGRSTAAALETAPDLSEAALYDLLRRNVEQHELVYGSCIAFEPHTFDPERRLFAPYVFRGVVEGPELQRMDVGADAYDYTELKWDWFHEPRRTGRAMWTEPFFDDGAGDVIMCTYVVPFFRDGKFRGTVNVDVRLDSLQERMSGVLADCELVAMVSKRGAMLSWPDPAAIMHKSIFDISRELGSPQLAQLGAEMIAGRAGAGRFVSPETGEPLLISYAPIPSTGWSYGAALREDEVMGPVFAELRGRALVAFAGVLAAAAVVLIMSWWLTRPVERLAVAVRSLAAGNLDAQVPHSLARDELGELSRAFNQMTAQLREHVAALTRATAAREAVESELRVARDIQTGLLPRTFPPYPHRPEFDLHAVAAPARLVGGDFFDFWFRSDHELALVIADVSGKSVPAAMFMAVTRTLLRNLATTTGSPAELLNVANRVLLEDNEHGMFVTAFLGYYDTRTGRLRYANAGHPPPYLMVESREAEQFGQVTGTVLGALEDEVYLDAEAQLAVGDRLVFYTDGITEARTPGGPFYGAAGLRRLLGTLGGESARGICNAIVREIDVYQKGERADDATVMVLRRNT